MSAITATDIEHIRKHSNIKARYRDAKFEARTDEQQKLVDAIRSNFGRPINEVKDMLIQGTVGTGKTHITIGALNSLIEKGIYCRYATEHELLELYFRKQYAKFDGFKEAKLLVIDEIGKRELQDWQLVQLEEIISYRYDAMLPTIYITNLDTKEFKHFIGDRATDRMKDNEIIRVLMTGDSLRGAK